MVQGTKIGIMQEMNIKVFNLPLTMLTLLPVMRKKPNLFKIKPLSFNILSNYINLCVEQTIHFGDHYTNKLI